MSGGFKDGWRRFYHPPDTMDGWAVRVLTIAVVLQLIASFIFVRMALITQDTLENNRQQRVEQVCMLMVHDGMSHSELGRAGCSPT